ncbi:HD domain-containing protein [Eubacteriales bacterium OttesenSCG-928-G02]|nr:HD domain-containing protein [Eubacteriales bacterium OttesenSCG-928-G02]
MLSLPDYVINTIDIITANKFEAYLVGGSVRDYIMRQNPSDYDIATNATPEQLKNIFCGFKIFETGLKHGTITLLYENNPVEITTYRVDGIYKDNRRPSEVMFVDSFYTDASRRDFTMNAIGYNPKEGFKDFFGGMADIKNKIIRCVGNAETRFEEDALRILRAVRFSAALGFTIEEETNSAVFAKKELLLNISAERINAELIKLLCGKNAEAVIIKYIEVFAVFLPELHSIIRFDQNTPYHKYDLLTHTAKTISNCPAEKSLRLAAFLHDIGKPLARTCGKDGYSHFKGHQIKSTELARSILNRLKFDNKTKNEVLFLIENHHIKLIPDEIYMKKLISRHGYEKIQMLFLLQKADNLAKGDTPNERYNIRLQAEETFKKIQKEKPCLFIKDLALKGNRLIADGVPPDNNVKIILSEILDQVIQNNLENNEEVLFDYYKNNYSFDA